MGAKNTLEILYRLKLLSLKYDNLCYNNISQPWQKKRARQMHVSAFMVLVYRCRTEWISACTPETLEVKYRKRSISPRTYKLIDTPPWKVIQNGGQNAILDFTQN